MSFIRTNLQAGMIARQLSGINRKFTTNLERLSTGLRVNRPDDSPGQFGVISNQKTQINALSQGVINAQNAAGMLQTAEEGINSIIGVLNRAHDLSITAADGTLTAAQRAQAQDEINVLITDSSGNSELAQILSNVKYNGLTLLSDSNKSAAVTSSTVGAAGGNREATTAGGTLTEVYSESIAASGNSKIKFELVGASFNHDADDGTTAAIDISTYGDVSSKGVMVIDLSGTATATATATVTAEFAEASASAAGYETASEISNFSSASGTFVDGSTVTITQGNNMATATFNDLNNDGQIDTGELAAPDNGGDGNFTAGAVTITGTSTNTTSNTADGVFKVGDLLKIERSATDGSITPVTDTVIVLQVNEAASVTNNIVVMNADSGTHTSDLNFGAYADNSGSATAFTAGSSAAESLTISRQAQTLMVDSQGAIVKSDSGFTFDDDTASNPSMATVQFKETLRLGVVLNDTSGSTTKNAALASVDINFSSDNAVDAAAKIEAAIENQLGGQYAKGGSLHIDVVAVADLYTATTDATTNFGGEGESVKVATDAVLTSSMWSRTQNAIGTTVANNLGFKPGSTAQHNAIELGTTLADLTSVRFKFTTTTTAGVNKTPQMRILSDQQATTDTNTRLFGNGLQVATGTHGNDKFLLTVDGEEVEVDLDAGAHAGSTNNIVDSFVSELENDRIYEAATADGLQVNYGRIGQTIGVDDGVVNNDSGGSSVAYTVGGAQNREQTGGYFGMDNLRTLIADGINNVTKQAADVSVAYDGSGKNFTITTSTRNNLSSLKVGKGVKADVVVSGSDVTSLVNTSTGTSGFIGALGLNQDVSASGTGSYFEFQLGGNSDRYAIQFDTVGATAMGEDLINISAIDVSTQGGAEAAVNLIESALESVSTTQTKIGAGINHLSRRINVMETHRENLRGSRARIEEIDFTSETRDLASLQILLQSSTAALAQANIIPQTLLQLLA